MAAAPAGGTNPLTADAADMQAKFYLRTGTIPAGFGGQGMRAQIIERATQIAKSEGKTVDDYISGRATVKADTQALAAITKVKSAAEGYANGAAKSLDLMVSLIPSTPEPLNMQILTRWARTGETEFGDVRVPPFTAALVTSLDQYAKVITGATGAQGATDSARNLALSLIPPGTLSNQIPGIVEVLKRDMGNKIAGYDEQIASLRGGLAKPPSEGSAPTPTKTEGGAARLPTIFTITKDQFAGLPSGTWFRLEDDPPGKHRVKP